MERKEESQKSPKEAIKEAILKVIRNETPGQRKTRQNKLGPQNYESKLKNMHIPNTLCFSPEECIKIYKSYNNTDSYPYLTLYTEVCQNGRLDNIIFKIIEERKNDIIKILSKPKMVKRGRPKADITIPFTTDKQDYQELYIKELKKLCQRGKGKKAMIIIKAAKDCGILSEIPTFKSASYYFDITGNESGYNSYKRKNLENESQYIDAKKKLEKIKSDIEK